MVSGFSLSYYGINAYCKFCMIVDLGVEMKLGRSLALRFAETMLYWRGHLRAKDIQDFLGVSERTARGLLADWRAEGRLPHHKMNAVRRLALFKGFDPGPPVTDPNIAFSLLLDADRVPGNPFSTTALPGGGHDLSISAKIPPGPTREILAACLERRAVYLIYAAKTGRQEFTFHPAAGVRARGRYHLRGYRADGRDAWGEQLDDRYVDVVPARAVEAWPAVDDYFVDLTDDRDWDTFETLHFVLSPALTEDERLCYEHEYGIADIGELMVEHRRALMPYVRQELMERRCWRRDGTCVPMWEMKE